MGKTSYIAALDAGSSSLSIAVGGHDDEGKLVLTGIVTRPMQGVARGEVDNRQQMMEALRDAVRDAEQELGVRISDVYTGTSGRHVKCTNHDYHVFVGEHSDGEIRQEDVEALHRGMENVQAEDGERIMDRIPQRYVVDGRETVKDPVGRFGKKLESTFNFVLASSMLVDRLEKTLAAVNVRVRKTFVNAIATARAVTLPEEREMGVAVIDLGAGTTDLCIWQGGAVRYVRGIPFGAGDIDNDIFQQGLLEKHVEGLKKTYGTAMASQVTADKLIAISGRGGTRSKQEISQKNLAIIIENRLREIINFVTDEIADSGYGSRLKGGIVLTGGGSRLAGVDELFREATDMDVRLATPDVAVAEESLDKASDPAHATVIGLLLKALEENAPVAVGFSEHQTVAAPRNEKPEKEVKVDKKHKIEEEEPVREKRPKKERAFSRWFGAIKENLASDILDGDEDF